MQDTITIAKKEAQSTDDSFHPLPLQIVFSDLDGTLIHYPDGVLDEENSKLILLPRSSSGLRGVLSHETLRLCQSLRQQGVKLVLISGVRLSTLLERLPFLPRADAYCCEAGGRIFYPVSPSQSQLYTVTPHPDTANGHSLEPFSLEEDMEWRARIINTIGVSGFVGNELVQAVGVSEVPIPERRGVLWNEANHLQQKGFRVDTRSYATCFRVNRKHQTDEVDFDSLLTGEPVPGGLSKATNLGCVDIFPSMSGKKNW